MLLDKDPEKFLALVDYLVCVFGRLPENDFEMAGFTAAALTLADGDGLPEDVKNVFRLRVLDALNTRQIGGRDRIA